jgi:hypothetical protein
MRNDVVSYGKNAKATKRMAQQFAAAGQGGWSAMYAEMQLAASLPAVPLADAPVRTSERVPVLARSLMVGVKAKRREVRSTAPHPPGETAGAAQPAVYAPAVVADTKSANAMAIAIRCATAARTVAAHALGWLHMQRVQRTTGRRLRVLETVSLGEKRFAALLSVDGAEFLIGGSGSSVSLLASVDNKVTAQVQ